MSGFPQPLPTTSNQQINSLGVGVASTGVAGNISASTLTITGVATLSGGTNTAGTAAVSTPTPSTGVAFTPNATQDSMLTFVVNTAIAVTLTFGPSTGAENTLISGQVMPIGAFFSQRIPANWKVVITTTIADLSNIRVTTC